ncbi:MAG: hypothetical protein J6W00_02530 [Lentisphaeria bacterium]|nr:hypothetical protein [Lentisphaeria bacterium]
MSEEYEEISIQMNAVKQPSEYFWYDDERCQWVKNLDNTFKKFQKDRGHSALCADHLMGLILACMESHLQEWGFIPGSIGKVKLKNHIQKLLLSNNTKGQNRVASEFLWYTVEMLRQEFSLAVPHPGLFFAALFHFEGDTLYIPFFKNFSVDMESTFNTCTDLYEGVEEESEEEAEDTCKELLHRLKALAKKEEEEENEPQPPAGESEEIITENSSDENAIPSDFEVQKGMFSEILQYVDLDPARCKLVRHSSSNTKVKQCLTNPVWFEAFQATQNRPVFDDCDYILIFLGESGTTARFVGCCQVKGKSELKLSQMPADFPYPEDFQLENGIFYHLQWTEILKEFWGKVVIDWGKSAVAWCQRATNDKIILSITEETGGALHLSSEPETPQETNKNLLTQVQTLLLQNNTDQALAYFSEAFYNKIPDEELEQTAVQCGAEFQYMLARLYLQWDAHRLNLAKAIHFAKMAAENGRISAGDLYNELCSQIIKIKTGE